MRDRRNRLDPELRAFVEGRRIGRRALAAVHQRALARAEAIVAGNGAPPPPTGRTTASPSTRFGVRRLRVGFALASLVAVLAGGIGAFAAIHRWLARSAGNASPTITSAPPAAPQTGSPLPASPPSPPVSQLDPRIAAPTAGATSSRTASGGPTRAAADAELGFLTRAHAAYARRDFATALTLIAEHAGRYPDGHLAEQREALRVRSLFGAHRGAEARQATLAFAERFPHSVLLAPLLEGPGAP